MKKLILIALVLFSTTVNASTRYKAIYHAKCEGNLSVFLDEDINDYSSNGDGAYNITTLSGKNIRMVNSSCMFEDLD